MLLIAGLFLILNISTAQAQQRVPQTRQEIQLSFAPLVKKAAPAVVNIYTRKTVTTRQFSPLFNDPFFRRFFGENFNLGTGKRRRVQNSLGSGVIVRSDGTIVTNHHVIEGADEIRVVLTDRREFEAKIVGSDERTDLAVLKISAANERFPHLAFRDSDELEVGDLVLAIGNPFGVGQTVTSGIVSALARTQVGINDLNFFIQTDAAINPGNSGGALISLDGRLIGVNSAIYSKGGGSVGIGFAIPSNMVRSVLAGVLAGGRLVRPWFGAEGQTVDANIAGSLGMKRPFGVLVNNVYPGGPADHGGIRTGDVILSLNGKEINDTEALKYRIATRPIGEHLRLELLRRGQRRAVRIIATAPPRVPRPEITELSGAHPLRGMKVANLSPALAEEIGMNMLRTGVVALEMRRGGAAARFGFQPGDILVEISGRKIKSIRSLKEVLVRKADKWRIVISRNGKVLSIVVNR